MKERLCSTTDAQLLHDIVHPHDFGADFIVSDNCYCWYYDLAARLQPRVIAEIGVRFGYSLYAMAVGARTRPVLLGLDVESYEPGCLLYAREKLAPVASEISLVRANSQEMADLPWAYLADMFHVDGDHTQQGCRHDMELAWAGLRPGGTLLVDDVDLFAELKGVCREFAAQQKTEMEYLPTLRGMAVMEKPTVRVS